MLVPMGNKPLRHSVACCCGRHPLRRVAWFLPPHPIAVYTSSAQLHIQGVAHSLWQPSFCLFCKSVLSWRIKNIVEKIYQKMTIFWSFYLTRLASFQFCITQNIKLAFEIYMFFVYLQKSKPNLKQHKSENFHFFVNCTFKKILLFLKNIKYLSLIYPDFTFKI